MRVVNANCFGAPSDGDLLLTDETALAAGSELPVRIADEGLDPQTAHDLSIEIWDLAYNWFKRSGHDLTLVDGVSAGDLAAGELALTVLLPAARAVLEIEQALADGVVIDALVPVVASGGSGHYSRVEKVQASAAAEAAHQLAGASSEPLVEVQDDRNDRFFRKYAATRDPDWLMPQRRGRRALARAVYGAVNAASRMRRRRPSIFVHEYNPTQAFARSYAAQSRRRFALVRYRNQPSELRSILRAGDFTVVPLSAPERQTNAAVAARLDAAFADEDLRTAFTFRGVELVGLLAPWISVVVQRYAAYAAANTGPMSRALSKFGVVALLLPFDGPPEARLALRVARSQGLPVLVINDGFKGDEIQREGLSGDVALAWSEAIASNYFGGRSRGRIAVTGNPKADRQRTIEARRSVGARLDNILVGSFTYSPLDLNCRRSDAERFTGEVLTGIASSQRGASARVTLKLHPADDPAYYAEVIAAQPQLEVEIVSSGDVVEMFSASDLYISTYSTSLLEAATTGLGFIYYRVNRQRLQPPFDGDDLMSSVTAESPRGLADLIDRLPEHLERFDETELEEWIERYLGPVDGKSVERIVGEIEASIGATGSAGDSPG